VKLTKNSLLTRNEDITIAKIDEELGMLNIETGNYYMINGIGSDIWKLLENKMIFNDLITQLMLIYDVKRDICEEETIQFLMELHENLLLIIEE